MSAMLNPARSAEASLVAALHAEADALASLGADALTAAVARLSLETEALESRCRIARHAALDCARRAFDALASLAEEMTAPPAVDPAPAPAPEPRPAEPVVEPVEPQEDEEAAGEVIIRDPVAVLEMESREDALVNSLEDALANGLAAAGGRPKRGRKRRA